MERSGTGGKKSQQNGKRPRKHGWKSTFLLVAKMCPKPPGARIDSIRHTASPRSFAPGRSTMLMMKFIHSLDPFIVFRMFPKRVCSTHAQIPEPASQQSKVKVSSRGPLLVFDPSTKGRKNSADTCLNRRLRRLW